MQPVLLIAGCRNPVLADYATHCARAGGPVVVVSDPCLDRKIKGIAELYPASQFIAGQLQGQLGREIKRLVLFLEAAPTAAGRALLDGVAELIRTSKIECLCIVSTFRVHLGDRAAAQAEAEALERLRHATTRIVILRPSHVRSPNSRLGAFPRSSWFCFPLIPSWFRGCCVEGEELFSVINRELTVTEPRTARTYTLLGANRPWRDRLRESRTGPVGLAFALLLPGLVAFALFRLIVALLAPMVAGQMPRFRSWHLTTLRPGSMRELLALCNPHNYRHIKVVGYNNGVVHFGHRYPGRTVVSTVACSRRARPQGDVAVFDAGVTIKKASDLLRPAGREFYVLPNYSYVSVGTSFFIPIHGSSTKFNTMGETIEKVLLYDPIHDKFLSARRDDPGFGEAMYNLTAEQLLLRLRIKTREKCRYYVKELRAGDLSGPEILNHFHDPRWSNVEVRKAGSRAETVQVFQYSTDSLEGETGREVPRDAIGRVWDRLEESPIASPLFHGLTRRFAYHVELFLSETEFATFWETHRSLPILKIQLRYIRKDGFPNSPFRGHDCVSADLFMLKKHRQPFDRYLREMLPAVKMNPGKHSM